MPDELPRFLHNRQWIIVLVLGIFGVVFGFSIAGYAIMNGVSPQSAVGVALPIFFAGWGIGYLMCVKTIRDLEKKRKLGSSET